jgi:hypothetical protein
MLARAFCSLLPELNNEESLEVAAIYSLRGALCERPPTATRPPFRAPHHSISRAGLIDGGSGLLLGLTPRCIASVRLDQRMLMLWGAYPPRQSPSLTRQLDLAT